VPKLKTHKGAKKRFKVSGSGKLLRMKGMSSHLRRKKPKRVKRLYDSKLPVSDADVPRLKKLLPYE
jgi:large subunit ribosomal protein L35|tara:strand:- start:169 stop:366 length:198 start_codon:yes stop_codon:yes gene_type:complete